MSSSNSLQRDCLGTARVLRWVVVLSVLMQMVGCGEVERRRAVVIGIDGADWKIIDDLALQGRLPNLSALRSRGSSAPLRTLSDIPLSPVIWTSVVTGKTAAKHGISWFMVDEPDGRRVPVRSHNRRVKALWNLLAEKRMRAISIGWWATYPAEDIGSGLLVSDALGFHGFGRTARSDDDGRMTYPPELYARANARIPTEQQIPAEFAERFIHMSQEEYLAERFDPARHPRRDPSNPIQLFQQYALTAQGYTAIAEDLLANETYDLFLLYYEQVDSFSHLFMKYDAPRLDWINEREFDRYRDVVREWYVYQDELLGRLLAHIDLETTAIFILSDHGFKSGGRRIRSEQAVDIRKAHLDHEPEGIFIAVGPGIRRDFVIRDASVMDMTPTLLAYLGLPVGKDMDGRVLAEIFEPAALESRPLRYVDSYEDASDRRDEEPAAEPYDAQALADNLASLEALGYIEKSGAGSAGSEEASSPEIHNNLGGVHLRHGDFDAARREFGRALALDPHNADALLNLGSIERMRGNLARAEHLTKRALKSDPNSARALAELAEIQRDSGKIDEAIRLYRQALVITDSMPFVFLGLGDSLQRAGQYDEAVAAFDGALALDPDSIEALYNLGVTYLKQGRLGPASQQLERVVSLDPNHPLAAPAHNNLGSILLREGRSAKATERFEQAVKASAVHLESRYNLATQYLQQGRVADAIGLLEQAAALAPNHEAVHTMLGTAYLGIGRNRDAYRTLELVRKLYPQNWTVLIGLAGLLAASDHADQAKALLAEGLALGGAEARVAANDYPSLASWLDPNVEASASRNGTADPADTR